MYKNINFYLPRIDSTKILRWSIGVVFVWFGLVKFFPGLSPAEDLASSTICALTAHIFPESGCLPFLAAVESILGLLLIVGRFLKFTLILLFLHMLGTFLTFFIFPERMFSRFPFVLTMEGQYVIKNIVILGACLSIWASKKKQKTINNKVQIRDNQIV